MKLRNLKEEDAVAMLEWMHDENIIENLGTNFMAKTINDCKNFIKNSLSDNKYVHFAIASNEDEYMGTVSLKNIDKQSKTAEFAITIRRCAMGKGYSQYGMTEMLNKGLYEYGLDSIYWCVSKQNTRALRFYDKQGYERCTLVPKHIEDQYINVKQLYWYSVQRGIL